jgi:hypothetical protein
VRRLARYYLGRSVVGGMGGELSKQLSHEGTRQMLEILSQRPPDGTAIMVERPYRGATQRGRIEGPRSLTIQLMTAGPWTGQTVYPDLDAMIGDGWRVVLEK